MNASTSSYEDMVVFFEQEGFISEDCEKKQDVIDAFEALESK